MSTHGNRFDYFWCWSAQPESARSRLFVGALWAVFAIFIYVLLSFHEPLRASTADILLILTLVAGVVFLR
jgi:hypothetical protein